MRTGTTTTAIRGPCFEGMVQEPAERGDGNQNAAGGGDRQGGDRGMTMISRFQMAVAAGVAGAIGMIGGGPAAAGIIPGGTGKSDCYAAIDVAGVEDGTSAVVNSKKITCTDGEACDSGTCGDGICNIGVAACINQPGLAGCTPPRGLQKLQVKGKVNIRIPQVLEGPACGEFLDVPIQTKKGGKKPGKAKFVVVAKAPKGTKPAKDRDSFELTCVPRTAACPPPTTTTTSSTTSTITVTPTTTSSTTTTTLPTKCSNGAPNGVVDPGEECDDANQNDGDGCTNACTVCGNSEITEPETCDDENLADEDFCPKNCRVDFCEPTATEIVATIKLNSPDVAALTVFVDYPEGRLTLQGIGGDIPPGILAGPGTATTQGFDFDHALRVVAFDLFNFGTTTLATIRFNGCQGVAPPQAQDFTCRLEGNATDESFAVVPGVTCSVGVQ